MDHRSKSSARSRLVSTLADEIIQHSAESFFAIASEHQLCRRFNVSRVTVRLALGDLEAKGLIFRRHGKGTFAYGRLDRVQRSLGVLLKTLPTAKQWPITEMIRGFHAGAAALRTNVLLVHASPQEWSSEMRKDLGGVLVFPTGTTRAELDFLEHIKLPVLVAWETNLPGRHVDFGQKEAARIVTERMVSGGHERIAFVSGFEKCLDAVKREGVFQALESVGMSPQKLVELALPDHEGGAEEIVADLVRHKPGTTAIIAADDSIALQLIESLSKHASIRVPELASVASFHRSPFSFDFRPSLSTVDFDFFEGGKQAAEVLSRTASTGSSVENIVIAGKIIEGSTTTPSSFFKRGIPEAATQNGDSLNCQ